MTLFLGSFLSYAKSQGRDVYEAKGIMVYSVDEAKIPMYVIFIPSAPEAGQTMEELITRAFEDKHTVAYVLYFQGIRWLSPDLSKQVGSLNHKLVKYGTKQLSQRLTLAKLLFDRTFRGDEEIQETNTTNFVPIHYNGNDYTLAVTEWPSEYGVLKGFTPDDTTL